MNGPKIIFNIPIFGGIPVTETIVNSWIVMAIIFFVSLYLAHDLKKIPKGKQVLAEKIVTMLYDLVEQTMGKKGFSFAPYIGTLFAFSLLSSLCGMFAIRPPTADFNTTLCWALMTFVLVHYQGIKNHGIGGWLHGFIEPIAVILPLNVIGELANPISLSFRHFGNIAAGLVITSLLYGGLTALTSMLFGGLQIPILALGLPAILSIYFDVFTAALQAFIFCMLTMVFVSGNMDD
ncbi:MAG: F0F1 ATP synthase subunit A [Oscillospiraceae bacterium]